MRKAILFFVAALFLSGCATTQYGSFVQDSPANYAHNMAANSVMQMATLYPPASTRLELQQAAPDAFGQALVSRLRDRGYAVKEFTPEPRAAAEQEKKANEAKATTPGRTYPLRYIFDQFPDSNMYRVTVLVGTQSLTRAFVAQNNVVRPAGAWVRKE